MPNPCTIIKDPSGRYRAGATFTASAIDGIILNERADPTGARIPLGFTVRWRDDDTGTSSLVVKFPAGMRRASDGYLRVPNGDGCKWLKLASLTTCPVCGYGYPPMGLCFGVCWKCAGAIQ